MSSHATTANRGSGLAASASMSAMPPSRCSPAPVSTCQDPVRLRSSMSIPPDSTSANTAAMYQPAGSHALYRPELPPVGGHRVLQVKGGCPDERGDSYRLGLARRG